MQNNTIPLDTGCGTYGVLGQLTPNIYLLDTENTGLFNFPSNIVKKYIEGNCGILATQLINLLGGKWGMYSVFIEDNKWAVPAHYIIRYDQSDLYIDIIGVRTKDKIVGEWKKYALDNKIEPHIIIKKTGPHMDNPDYECNDFTGELQVISQQIAHILYERFKILKIIEVRRHPFFELSSYTKVYKKDKFLLGRVACNYTLLASLGIGPKVDTFLCDHALVVIMQYLPISSTNDRNAKHSSEITSIIHKMHDLYIFHGDLHGSNIAYDDKMHPYIIDADTLFLKQELDSNEVVNEWLKFGFGMNINQYENHEKNIGWRYIQD